MRRLVRASLLGGIIAYVAHRISERPNLKT
jgi:hypothetical protein